MQTKVTQKRFEEIINDLEAVVKELEDNKLGLEEGLSKFETGVELYKHCKTILDQAEKKINKINESLTLE